MDALEVKEVFMVRAALGVEEQTHTYALTQMQSCEKQSFIGVYACLWEKKSRQHDLIACSI